MKAKQKFGLEIGINTFFIMVVLMMSVVSKNYDFVQGTILGARTFPILVGIFLSLFALVNIAASVVRYRKNEIVSDEKEQLDSDSSPFVRSVQKYRVQYALGLLVCYYLLLLTFGFIISTLIFIPSILFILEYRKPVAVSLVTVIGVALLYIAFKVLLGVPLPQGFLFS
ncbi:MAG: tripartite tricarboxylate transporter TctB family protein [Sphaerochaetaceae bacterium]|nr:tripartite tricarboxylate transporter TctB family protein [Sphaerochaetaceae bacterium]